MLDKIRVCSDRGNLLCIVSYTDFIKVFLYQIDEITKTQKEIQCEVYNVKKVKDALDDINKDFGLCITERDL